LSDNVLGTFDMAISLWNGQRRLLDFGDLNFTACANGYRQIDEMHWLEEAGRAAALRRDTRAGSC
jgi:hypothetical protein